jgi:hypothetical protein
MMLHVISLDHALSFGYDNFGGRFAKREGSFPTALGGRHGKTFCAFDVGAVDDRV